MSCSDRSASPPKSYQENLRTSFTLGGARLEIDTWPLIPPYLEIEAESNEDVVRVAELLGFDKARLTGENTTKVYARFGIDLEAIADLRLPDGDFAPAEWDRDRRG